MTEIPDDGARRNAAALEAMYKLVRWLVPTLDRSLQRQRFLLAGRIPTTALAWPETVIEAASTRNCDRVLDHADADIDRLRHMAVETRAGTVTKRTHRAAALAAAAWLAVSAAAVPAAERVALVIGNGAYGRIQPLDNPVNDATLMGETLRELGFDVSVKTDANLGDMNAAIRRFGKRLRAAGPGAVGLFFYAGHGVQSRGRNYLIPLDAPIDVEADLELEAIRAQGVLGQMRDAGSGLNIVVLDACRSNPFPGSARSGTRGLSRIEAPKGSLIAYSASPGQVAKDGAGENSPYTAALAQAMRRPGLELRDVFQSVRKAVLARTGNEQLSWEENSLTDKWYFRAPVSGGGGLDEGDGALSGGGRVAAAQRLEIEREFWASIKGSRSPAKFRAYLERFGENGAFAALARIELEELGGEGAEPGPAVDEAREAWEIAERAGTVAAYRAVAEHFSGFYATLAQRKVEELEAAALAEERRARREALAEKLGRGFSPDAVGETGWTDLHWAAALDLPGLARELVERGMEVDVRLDEGGASLPDSLKRTLRELGRDFDDWESDGETPLHVTARENALSVAEYLTGQGADVNAKESDFGGTPLHYAALSDALGVAELLIGHGAEVNAATERESWTPLHTAAWKGALSVVEYLAGQGADVNARTDRGQTPLHVAANPALSMVKYLVGQGLDVNAKDDGGWTVLHSAADGSLSVVKYLVDQGADVNAKADDGSTVLHSAADGSLSVVKYLVGQGADVNTKTDGGWTVLHSAADGSLSVVKYLVGQGADVNAKTDGGWTVLHSAADGSLSVVKYLVGQGLDMNAKADDGWTVLHSAADGSLSVVKYLVDQGADVNIRGFRGSTPLYWAVNRSSSLPVVKYLVGQGADVNAKRDDGLTPLHRTAYNDPRSVVKYLVGQGADVNARSERGETPLNYAAFLGAFSMSQILVGQGVDVNARDEDGRTPLHSAARYGFTSVARYLAGQGADMRAVDGNGDTPLDLAMKHGHDEVAALLRGRLEQDRRD